MRITPLILGFFLLPSLATAADLLRVYQDALSSAPALKADEATMRASDAGVGIGLSAYLPQVALIASASSNEYSDNGDMNHYGVESVGATLTQAVFDFNQLATIRVASHTAKAADLSFSAQQQAFIVTVASDYFALLNAAAIASQAQAKVDSLDALFDQTSQKFKVGLSTYTDVALTKANDDSAKAARFVSDNALAIARENLYALTNKDEGTLADLSEGFRFSPPTPVKSDDWVSRALKNNPTLMAQRATTQAAYDNVYAVAGNQLPVISFVATDTVNSIGQTTPAVVSVLLPGKAASVGLNFTWTIFSGGEQFASALQAAKQYEASEDLMDNTYRTTISQTRQDFLSVMNSLETINAYRQSVISAKASFDEFQEKYRVGTATMVDVLNQLQALYQAKSNLSNAKYSYVTNLLNLKSDAGTLCEKDIATLNQQLQVPAVTKKMG